MSGRRHVGRFARWAAAAAASTLLGAVLWHVVAHPEPEGLALPLRLAGHRVTLLEPRRLLLLATLPLLLPAAAGSLTDLPRPQIWLSASIRALLLAGLVLALSRPTIARESHKVSAVILVDVSASISDAALADAQRFVVRAWNARSTNELRVVRFARHAEEIAPPANPTAPFPPIPRFTERTEEDATDIEAALQLGTTLLSPGTLHHVVLLSDGRETEGAAIAEVSQAQRLGVTVSTRPLPADDAPEVSLRALHLPEEIRPEAPFAATAEIWSNENVTAEVSLYQNGFLNGLEPHKSVPLRIGRTDVQFRTVVHAGGVVTYRAALTTQAPDHLRDNNQVVAAAVVHGPPKVLYVEGEPSYAGDLSRALRAQDIDVDVRGPGGVPASVGDLAPYDLVILSDVPAAFVGPRQMAALTSYVRELGGGFLMAGGDDSFGSGGYAGSALERLLPVTFADQKKRDEAKLALILVIDRSGSMGTGSGGATKIELAKEAAKSTAEIMNPDDLLGVIAFDTLPSVVVRLQRAANRVRIADDISRLAAGGGTQILPALQEAFQELSTIHAKIKHVILLTDGQSSIEGLYPLVDEMASPANRVTVSTVGVGEDADRDMLATIAEKGQGKFYFTRDPASIPRIFTDDASEAARSSIVESAVGVHVAKAEPFLRGIDFAHAPPLRGYVSTQAKPGAEVALVTDSGEPLLALWSRGLGRALAWTSDVKARWSTDWIAWTGFQQLWGQLVRAAMRHGTGQSFDVSASVVDDSRAHVVVDAITADERFADGLTTQLTVLDPQRPAWQASMPLEQTAPGRYEGDVSLPRYGTYLLRASQSDDSGSTVAISEGTLALPYPEELLIRPPDRALLAQLANLTGGRVAPSPADSFDAAGASVLTPRDLWPELVLAMAGLLLLDVFLRRVRLFRGRPLAS